MLLIAYASRLKNVAHFIFRYSFFPNLTHLLDEYEPLYEGLGYNKSVIQGYLEGMKNHITSLEFMPGNMRKKRSVEDLMYDDLARFMPWSDMDSGQMYGLDEPTQWREIKLEDSNPMGRRLREPRSSKGKVIDGPVVYGDVNRCWKLAKPHIGEYLT